MEALVAAVAPFGVRLTRMALAAIRHSATESTVRDPEIKYSPGNLQAGTKH